MSAFLNVGKIIMLTSTPFLGYPLYKKYPQELKDLLALLQATESAEEKFPLIEPHIEFALAIFLLAVQKYAYFSYHDNVNASLITGNATFDNNRFNSITRELGEPYTFLLENLSISTYESTLQVKKAD